MGRQITSLADVQRLIPTTDRADFQSTIAFAHSYMVDEVSVESIHKDLVLVYVSGLWAASTCKQKLSRLSTGDAIRIVSCANSSIERLEAAKAHGSAMRIKDLLVQEGFLPGLS